ncbi:MAG: tetratricopeptide repeat protein [Anaerolineales bacterium]|nr:tetratricopeptide repeat protein [Anaerolineales bacterium]
MILTRAFISLPDLPLLVARSQVGGIGLHELAFRADEIQALMLQNYQQMIPENIAEELERKTEGWITGLLLSAYGMWQGMVDQLRLIRTSGIGLYDYLINQVLDQQPPELRDFLLRTSFFEEFNAELCAALLGTPPQGQTWQGVLKRVLENNLFILPLGEGNSWLRYHHLFRDFLQNRLAWEQPEEVERILKSLITIYIDRAEWERAYQVCLRLGDIERTADLLEQVSEPLVRSGRMALLGKWMNALPAVVINQRPALLARQGIVLATQGDTTRGLQLLDQAVNHYRAEQDWSRLAGALVRRALVQYIRSNCANSIADAIEALSLTEQDTQNQELNRFRAEAYRILGQNFRLLGNLDEAINNLSKALHLHQLQEDAQGVNLILLNLGPLYMDAGDLAAASACYQQVIEYYREREDLFNLGAALNDLAFLHHQRGEFTEAFATYEQALAKAQDAGNVRTQAMVLIGLGDLFVDLEAPDAASEAYNQARPIVERLMDHFLIAYLDLAEAAVARLQGEIPRARTLLESAGKIVLQTQSDYTRGLLLTEAGRLAITEGDYCQASTELAKAVQIFESGGQRVFGGRASLLLATARFGIGETEAAWSQLDKAFHLVSVLDSPYILVPSAHWAKPLLSDSGLSPVVGQKARYLLKQVEQFDEHLPELRRSLRFQKMTIPLSPPKLRIRAFGKAQVMLGDTPITTADWHSQTTRDLLYLLLSEPRGLSRDVIGECLWSSSSPVKLKHRFKNSIYRLRRALQQDVIVFDNNYYTFNRDLDYEYDVERFLELLNQVKESQNIEERRQVYEELIQLYQGEYLPEVNGFWVLPERERFRQFFLSAGLQLSTIYLETSRHDLALEVCQRLIIEDPYLEGAYQIAMQIHAATGNRSAIVRLYEKLKEALNAGLGHSPSAQMESFYRSLVH